ncbi:SPOR domain-containing protein [Spirochaetia bacterium 38H-sp]|uniref:SPOR domain-containing protein n=1 Tax=Rarispira pelagica TaxID=3141764 RepID=A0ABU9UBA2_9SPIR
MSKKALLLIYFFILIGVMFAQNIWQGNATVSQYGEFPPEGYYGASNAFPVNSIVEVTNIENGKTTRVIITRGLSEEGLLLLLSADAARELEVPVGSIARIKAKVSPINQTEKSSGNSGKNAVKDVDLNPAVTIPQEIIDNPPTPTPPPWEAIVSLDKPKATDSSEEVLLDSSLIAPEESIIPAPTPEPTSTPKPVVIRPEPVETPTPVPAPTPTPSAMPTVAATLTPETPETTLESPKAEEEQTAAELSVEPSIAAPASSPTPAPVAEKTPVPTTEPINILAAKKTESPISGTIEKLTQRTPLKTLAIPPRKENPFVFLPEPKLLVDLTDKDIVNLPEVPLPQEEIPQISMENLRAKKQEDYIPSLTEPVIIAESEESPTVEEGPSISFFEPSPPPFDVDIPLVEPDQLLKEEVADLPIEQPSIPDTALVVPQEEPLLTKEEIAETSMPQPTQTPTDIPPSGENMELSLVPAEERPPSPEHTHAPSEEDLIIEGIVDALSQSPTPTPTPSPAPDTAATTIPTLAKELPLVKSLKKGYYYVQLGAYKTTESALKMVNRMGITYPVIAIPLEKDGKIIYRILVGPLNHDESGTLVYWFKAQGFKDVFIQRGE